jgi:hypothetical protein
MPSRTELRKFLDPYIKLAPFVGIGLAVVAIVIAWVFYMQRGAHVELRGSIQKVRTLALDDKSSAAVLDFRVTNPSDYAFQVRSADVSLVDAKGQAVDGMPISEVDAGRLFEYYAVQLGQKYNPSMTIRTRIAAHQTIDRMLAVRFDVPQKTLDARRELRVRIEEVDGPVAEVVEGRGKP